jgi:hypothetical protein
MEHRTQSSRGCARCCSYRCGGIYEGRLAKRTFERVFPDRIEDSLYTDTAS